VTKKDFELIAKVVNSLRDYGFSGGEADAVAFAFSTCLAKTNTRFNRKKFLRACGVEQ